MAITPKVRTGLTHVGTAVGGAVASIAFMSSHSVDIYALVDQVNVIIADVTKLIALATPIATGAYAVWKSSQKEVMKDAAAVPGTTVVTTAALSAATPDEKNIVSNTQAQVVAK